MKTLPLSVLMLAMAGVAAAQNSDLAFLAGVAHSSVSIGNGRVFAQTRFGLGFDYAFQFLERPAGRLYVELPVVTPINASVAVGPGVAASDAGRVFFAPGIRYQVNVSPRVAVFAAAGGGIAWKSERISSVSGTGVTVATNSHASGLFDFGGGLDFRLTRLLSIRGEVRDFVTSPRTGFDNWNNPSAQFGFALHF